MAHVITDGQQNIHIQIGSIIGQAIVWTSFKDRRSLLIALLVGNNYGWCALIHTELIRIVHILKLNEGKEQQLKLVLSEFI